MTKKVSIYLIVTFSICLLISCSNSSNRNVIQSLDDMGIILEPNISRVFLIPNAGCPGCTTSAESFMVLNLESHEVIYILTNFTSVKNITSKLGKDVIESFNVHLDTENIFYTNGVITPYPIIYHIEGGRITKSDTVSPYSPNSIALLELHINE